MIRISIDNPNNICQYLCVVPSTGSSDTILPECMYPTVLSLTTRSSSCSTIVARLFNMSLSILGAFKRLSIILLLPCGPSYLALASAQPYSAMPFCNSKSPRLPIIFRFILVTDEIIRSSFLRIEVLTLADSPLIKQCKFENWLNIRL